jgi:hypothetical protein
LKSQFEIWVKENERTIAFIQSYRIRNSFPNPIYVDDILLASSDVNLLHEKKKFLSSRFNKNVLGEMSLVIIIEIRRDRRKGVLGLSHRHAKKSF